MLKRWIFVLTPFTVILFTTIILIQWPLVSAWIKKNPKKEINSFNQQVEEESWQILQKMTLPEKVGQLFHVNISQLKLTTIEREQLADIEPGGIILFTRNLHRRQQIRKLTGDLQSLARTSSGIPLFISTDQEGGVVNRVKVNGVTQFPNAMALGQINNEEIVEKQAFITAYQLSRLGINYVLAPVLDVNSNPKNPVINVRSYGSDPQLVTRMGNAYLTGNLRSLTLAAIKHFPGHGDTHVDSHLALPTVNKTRDRLWQSDFRPFRQAINAGAESIMLAHIVYSKIDNQYPAPLSAKIIQGILRKQMNFQGLVVTDDLGMKAISKNYGFFAAIRLALVAGADILLLADPSLSLARISRLKSKLINYYEEGLLSKSKLDTSILRQIRLKVQKGLFHQHRSPRTSTADLNLKIIFAEKRKQVKEYYRKLMQNEKPEQFNERISQLAIRSLQRKYQLPQIVDLSQAKFILLARKIKTHELPPGLRKSSIHFYNKCDAIDAIVSRFQASKVLILEFNNRCRKKWNRMQASTNRNQQEQELIGLYLGNPYQPVKIPLNGGILVSFSATPASRKALIKRLFVAGKQSREIQKWEMNRANSR